MVTPGPSVLAHHLNRIRKRGSHGKQLFHSPSRIPGFWLLQTFLTETKCLFVVCKA